MGKHYSEELKNEIIEKYLKGNESFGSLGKTYGISRKTIFGWLKKYKNTGSLKNDIYHNRGRQKEENINYKERYEILKKYQTFLKAQREKK